MQSVRRAFPPRRLDRLIADKSAVGLYAETLTELCLTLDERVQDNYCEYREISAPAAIFFDGENDERNPWKLGTKDGPLANVPEDFADLAAAAVADVTAELAYKAANSDHRPKHELRSRSELRLARCHDGEHRNRWLAVG
jgi:hypothetical protein